MSISHRIASNHGSRGHSYQSQPRRPMVFVFGSNTAGIHGAGAARTALLQHGAKWGVGEGHVGDSYALPTKDQFLKTLPILTIDNFVNNFIHFARANSKLKFQVTQLGCGLAGLKPEHIAPMFEKAPENCYFDHAWRPHLPERSGDPYRYWGTFP